MASYKCGRCGRTVDIDPEKMGIKCPICGSKTFYKERGTVTKRIKAQ